MPKSVSNKERKREEDNELRIRDGCNRREGAERVEHVETRRVEDSKLKRNGEEKSRPRKTKEDNRLKRKRERESGPRTRDNCRKRLI